MPHTGHRCSCILLVALALGKAAQGFDYTDDGWRVIKETGSDYELDDPQENEENIEYIKREPNYLGSLPDEDFNGMNEKTYDTKTPKAKSKKQLRSSELKKRGFTQKLQISPTPLPHTSHPKEVKGCGNPICVILDRKVRRFPSLCAFARHIKKENRQMQMNYVQKGDCYDIIDNADKKRPNTLGGAFDKPWINPTEDVSGCQSCNFNPDCKTTVTINIDSRNLIDGTSSAFGGPHYHQNGKKGHTAAQRYVGIPLQFDSICALMCMLRADEKTNIKTQVIGVAFAEKEKIFPLEGSTDACLWTEWFDHDTPCNSDGDVEKHTEHFQRLKETMTGPWRICSASEMRGYTQHEGGSEIRQVSADDARDGRAVGTQPQDPFRQIIKIEKLELSCKDTEQIIPKLPAPYIYHKGIEGDPRKNATCLDYKTRYCCSSTAMYRPQAVGRIQSLIPPRFPLGPILATITENLNRATLKVYPIMGYTKRPAIITIEYLYGDVVLATVEEGGSKREYDGSWTKKQKDGTMTRIICDLFPVEVGQKRTEGLKVTVKLDVIGGQVVRSDIKHGPETYCGTKISKTKATTQVRCSDMKKPKLHIASWLNGTEIKREQGNWEACFKSLSKIGNQPSDKGKVRLTIGVWEKVAMINQIYQSKVLIEAPPLASLFSECVWRDWINEDYPNKHHTGREYELRNEVLKSRRLEHHVCGPVLEAAHYVDAVTMEKRVPWYELDVSKPQEYEVYKLSPFHGYYCNDQNMPNHKEYCQDMKVRYCCTRALRAQWSEWGEWSSCSVTCGGGQKTRTKTCERNELRKEGSNLWYNQYNRKCVGEDDKKKQMSLQTVECNVKGCPVAYEWGGWSQWTSCSTTCDMGTKRRVRGCTPARNDGTPCPRKEFNTTMGLFEQKIQCTKADCATFRTTLWTTWSACSATCGKGQKTRKRQCENMQTLQIVDGLKCPMGDTKDFYDDKQTCKIEECAIDGGWSKFEAWSKCDQKCISHPDAAGYGQGTVVTKAKMTRKRHCNMPLPQFGGKFCKKDEKYKYISHEKAEMEAKDCCNENNKDSCEGEVVGWCPENCVFSSWGEWSACSQTCMKPCSPLKNNGTYRKNHPIYPLRYAKEIIIDDVCTSRLPTRVRARTILRPQRFGGSCDVELMAKHSKDDKMVLYQDEDCELCKEHCWYPDGLAKTIHDMTALTYPHPKNPKCVGFCPEDCKWEKTEVTYNCQEEWENYLNNEANEKEKENKCYESKVITGMTAIGVKVKDADAYRNEAYEIMTKSKDVKIGAKAFPDTWKGLKSLEKWKKEGDFEEAVRGRVENAWDLDRNFFKAKTKYSEEQWAVTPNLDGAFGGKGCQRTQTDGKYLTIKGENRGFKIDKSKYHNEIPYHKMEKYVCDIPICDPIPLTTAVIEEATTKKVCKVFTWTAWGEWGGCDLKCGDQGKITRKRKCVDNCGGKVHDNSKCRTFFSTFDNKNYTDTQWTPCVPCPADEIPQWSQWQEQMPSSAKCDVKMDIIRTRICKPSKTGKKDCPPDADGNKNEKIQPVPGAPCTSDDGYSQEGSEPAITSDPARTPQDANVDEMKTLIHEDPPMIPQDEDKSVMNIDTVMPIGEDNNSWGDDYYADLY